MGRLIVIQFILFLSELTLAATTPQVVGLKLRHWYVISKDSSLPVIRRVGREKSFNLPVRLKKLKIKEGTEFSVLGVSKDGAYTLLGIDADLSKGNPGVKGKDPVIVWAKTADLVASVEVKNADIKTQDALASMGIETKKPPMDSSNTPETGMSSPGDPMSHCLRDVHIASVRISRRSVPKAEMASKAMPKYIESGWLQVDYSPQVPLGTVCFFSGGRRCGRRNHCGHAAIKIRKNTWEGAGMFPTPFLRSHHYGGHLPYRLQGCVIPPDKSKLCQPVVVNGCIQDLTAPESVSSNKCVLKKPSRPTKRAAL